MAFVAGTLIFTRNGWKKIDDLSGHDRVLVRNFLGDAEFIQPFALKKRQYDGEIIKIGAKDWSFSVTPEHIVVYDKDKYAQGVHFYSVPAKDFTLHHDNRIYRKFKYMFSEEPSKEMITVWDDFGKRSVTISNYDWYKLVGYVLCRGFIRKKPGRPMLFIFLEKDWADEEIKILGDILDRIGVGWYVQYSEVANPRIVVSSKNTLVGRLVTRLGSSRRKKMFLPDKMIYNSTKELAKLLIDTIIAASIQPGTERRTVYQLATTNIALINTLVLLGTLSGYGMRSVLRARAGEPSLKGIMKVDSYTLQISGPKETYQPRYSRRFSYSGVVYEIDLFDGQVYVREGSMPVWINPK